MVIFLNEDRGYLNWVTHYRPGLRPRRPPDRVVIMEEAMATSSATSSSEIERLRSRYYNSVVTKISLAHDDLMILRLRPDSGMPQFLPGQFTVLGLGEWEQQIEDIRCGLTQVNSSQNLVKRAYSISCSLIDDIGRPLRTSDCPYLEFYVRLVRTAESHRPALTPRLFALREGSRLYCSPEVRGRYTLEGLRSNGNVVFVATGTGEAPHNAMVAELLVSQFQGQIVSVTCARQKHDLAYSIAHRKLERQFPNYRYLTLTTREPENFEPTTPGFIGKRYLQDYFMSGDFERDAQLQLSPANTHLFLCGSPDMIGASRAIATLSKAAKPIGMVEFLESRGFRLEHSHSAGNIHVERYW